MPVGLRIACSGEDHIFHLQTAQALGRLFAEHPGDRVGDVRFSAAVGTDNSRYAFSCKLYLGTGRRKI